VAFRLVLQHTGGVERFLCETGRDAAESAVRAFREGQPLDAVFEITDCGVRVTGFRWCDVRDLRIDEA
jgi:hypothetical protein